MSERWAMRALVGALLVLAPFATASQAQPVNCALLKELMATLAGNLEAEKVRQNEFAKQGVYYQNQLAQRDWGGTESQQRAAMQLALKHARDSFWASDRLIDATRKMIVQTETSYNDARCATASPPPQAATPIAPPQASAAPAQQQTTSIPPNQATYHMEGVLKVCDAKPGQENFPIDFTIENGRVTGTYLQAFKFTGTVDGAGKIVVQAPSASTFVLHGTVALKGGKWQAVGTYPHPKCTSHWTATER